MITIFLWTVFLVLCIAPILLIMLYISIIGDSAKTSGSASYIIPISLLLINAIPFVAISIVDNNILYYVWLVALCIVMLLSLQSLYYVKYSFHYLFSFLFSIVIGISTISIQKELLLRIQQFTDVLAFEKSNNVNLILELWLPVLLISITTALVLRHKTIIVHDNKNESETKNRASRIDDMMVRLSIESLSEKVAKQNTALLGKIKELSIYLEEIKNEKSYRSSEGNIKPDLSYSEDYLKRIFTDIEDIRGRVYANTVSEITVTNQLLVRELHHFLETPLSTIASDSEILRSISNTKNKEKSKYVSCLDRISSAVDICNGILSTYKEIFLCYTTESNKSLTDLLKESFNVLVGQNEKSLELHIKIQFKPDEVSFYYVVSTVLPLLSNAICAAKPNSSIEIFEIKNGLKITNTFEGDIELDRFNDDYFSTKPNHKGLGLFTVRHLLANRKMGELKYYICDNRVIFEIPIKAKDNE